MPPWLLLGGVPSSQTGAGVYMFKTDCLEGGQVYCCCSIRYEATQEAGKRLDKRETGQVGVRVNFPSLVCIHTYRDQRESESEREKERE